MLRRVLLLFLASAAMASAASGEDASPGIMLVPQSQLAQRAVCGFGESCGNGCASGPCCDDAAGISCVKGSECAAIGGTVGCCPVGATCDRILRCMDFGADECAVTDPAPECCPKDAPYCDRTRNICAALPVSSPRPSRPAPTPTPLPTTPDALPAHAQTTILFETHRATVPVATSLVLDGTFPTRTFAAVNGAQVTVGGSRPPSLSPPLLSPSPPPSGSAAGLDVDAKAAGGNLTRFESGSGGKGSGRSVCTLLLAGLGAAAAGFSLL